jgi:ABC-type glycerol-3-phosphate transport system substrate-binding protein
VADERLKDFTQQTGIGVKHLPTPETALDQLDLVRKLLQQASSTPDVYGVDVIWPGVLSEELTDLKPFLATELASINYEARTWPELYDPTAILRTKPNFADNEQQVSGVVARPSTVAGRKYEEVSRAYIQAVRTLLLGKSTAPDAAASLEQELVRITGFKPGPSSRNRAPKDKSSGKAS